MFENIGSKIKTLASVVCWIGIIASIISAIGLFTQNIVGGLVALIGGPLMSWISSFVLYGFGELVENSSILAGKVSGAATQQKDM